MPCVFIFTNSHTFSSMKRTFYIITFIHIVAFTYAQQTINGTILHNNLTREYILYVPASYEEGTPAPLVFNFHGYTSNALQQMFYGDFRPIADTAGFVVVHPQGTNDQLGNPHWNVGWGSSTVDDVGFTKALIDSLSEEYTINPERIYSTGMSNGGFFSYKLACELSDKIAAIASVTGSMNTGQNGSCSPSHPMPVMEVHGTADPTVPYTGNFAFAPIPSVVNFWVDFNDTETTPVVTLIEDTNTSDGSTAEHYLYEDGNNGVDVEHYKILNGGHTWPGTAFGGAGTNQDVNASKEIWRFFSQYDINGLINPTAVHPLSAIENIQVYPNPTTSAITIQSLNEKQITYNFFDLTGQLIFTGNLFNGFGQLQLNNLSKGLYLLKVENQLIKIVLQ